MQEPDASFDLLMLDAFSSDSVPAHLLSREAVELYKAKLKEDGVLLFHASNRYLKVEQLISSLLANAGLATFSRFDKAGALQSEGKTNATYVVAARRAEYLGSIAHGGAWKRVTLPGDIAPWTDDYSNLFNLIRWF